MTIRIASLADLNAARTVCAAAFVENRAVYFPKATARAVISSGDPDITQVVAVDNGELLGTTCFWPQNGACRLGAVAVDPRYRGRGVARALLEYIEGLCRGHGMGVIVALTIRQAGQVQFYERLGFVMISEREPTWAESATGQPITEVELHKTL